MNNMYEKRNGKVAVTVVTGYGINADRELAEAFNRVGGDASLVHITDLLENPSVLKESSILAFPGGFSFGDHLGSGLVFAHMCRNRLKPYLEEFISQGKLILGICNGFQVLVKMGILPDLEGEWNREATLTYNSGACFIDSWVRIIPEAASACVWTRGLNEMDLPVRHGEGRFVMNSEDMVELLEKMNCVALRYRAEENPNGSVNNIAGITDRTGRILGLMPHPEAYMIPEHHPRWNRETNQGGLGLDLLRNGVHFVLNTAGKG